MPGHHGSFVWYELMTTDCAAAAPFYRDVVGWNVTDAGPDYALCNIGDIPVAGLLDMPPRARANGAPIGWSGYIAVDDVDAAVASLVEAGGSVHQAAFDIPGIGRVAVAADPLHAAFVLFKPSGTRPALPAPATPGLIGWHELHVDDPEAAFAFYNQQFGWTEAEAIDMGPIGVYQLFAVAGTPVGGMMTRQASTTRPQWIYYINVADIAFAAARVVAAGGTVVNGPRPVPGGSVILHGRDTQGALVAFVQPAA